MSEDLFSAMYCFEKFTHSFRKAVTGVFFFSLWSLAFFFLEPSPSPSLLPAAGILFMPFFFCLAACFAAGFVLPVEVPTAARMMEAKEPGSPTVVSSWGMRIRALGGSRFQAVYISLLCVFGNYLRIESANSKVEAVADIGGSQSFFFFFFLASLFGPGFGVLAGS